MSSGDPGRRCWSNSMPTHWHRWGSRSVKYHNNCRIATRNNRPGILRVRAADLALDVDTHVDSLTSLGETPIRYGGQGRFVNLADIATISKAIVAAARLNSLLSTHHPRWYLEYSYATRPASTTGRRTYGRHSMTLRLNFLPASNATSSSRSRTTLRNVYTVCCGILCWALLQWYWLCFC